MNATRVGVRTTIVVHLCARCGQPRSTRKDRPAQGLCRDCTYVEPRWGK